MPRKNFQRVATKDSERTSLTPIQKEALVLISQGLSTQHAANQLQLPYTVVKKRVAAGLKNLGLSQDTPPKLIKLILEHEPLPEVQAQEIPALEDDLEEQEILDLLNNLVSAQRIRLITLAGDTADLNESIKNILRKRALGLTPSKSDAKKLAEGLAFLNLSESAFMEKYGTASKTPVTAPAQPETATPREYPLLSKSERRTLELAAQCMSIEQIAEKMNCTVEVVQERQRRGYSKLGKTPSSVDDLKAALAALPALTEEHPKKSLSKEKAPKEAFVTAVAPATVAVLTPAPAPAPIPKPVAVKENLVTPLNEKQLIMHARVMAWDLFEEGRKEYDVVAIVSRRFPDLEALGVADAVERTKREFIAAAAENDGDTTQELSPSP